jgi:phospholipid transport system transporter-binding protein
LSTNYQIGVQADGRVSVSGELTFATARGARSLGRKVLDSQSGSEVRVDCSGVSRGDSAGLAVLLDWLASARAAGRHLRYENLPRQIVAIAEISELDELLATHS